MKRHYEKIIVACCFVSFFVNVGLNSTSFAVYQPYIVALPGIGDVSGSIILSLRILVSVIATLFVNQVYNLLDLRLGLAVATAFTGAAFFVYSIATTLPLFLLGAVLGGIAYGVGGMVATTMLVNRWFKSGIGTAVGIASVGSGVAGFVVPVAAASIIEAQSLSAAFLCESVLAFAVALIVFVFLRNRPEDIGVAPHESKVAESGRGKEQAERIASGLKLALPERVLVLVAMCMLGGFSMGGISYMSVLFVTNGFDAQFAALLLSIAGGCLMVSKFLAGEMFDRLGTPLASFIMFSILGVGIALCCLSQTGSIPVAVCAAVFSGLGLSLGSVGLSVWSIELSSPEYRQKSIRNCQVGFSFGGFVMNAIPGPLKELTGTYVTSYVIILGLVLVAAFIILGIYRRHA